MIVSAVSQFMASRMYDVHVYTDEFDMQYYMVSSQFESQAVEA
jgi:hypothetical protein